MKARTMTAIFIVAIIVLIAVYDVYIILTAGKAASISWMLIEYSYEAPSFSFLSGFVCGHVFWRMKKPKELKDE